MINPKNKLRWQNNNSSKIITCPNFEITKKQKQTIEISQKYDVAFIQDPINW